MNRKGAAVPERVQGFRIRRKALRGEPHEHFRHETGPGCPMSDERLEGSQTLGVFLVDEASSARL